MLGFVLDTSVLAERLHVCLELEMTNCRARLKLILLGVVCCWLVENSSRSKAREQMLEGGKYRADKARAPLILIPIGLSLPRLRKVKLVAGSDL